jgi:hypothetical protein
MKKFWNWVRDSDTQTRTLYLNGAIAEESCLKMMLLLQLLKRAY